MIYLRSLQSTGDIVRWAGHSSGGEKLEFWQENFLQNHKLGRWIMRWEEN
jgi:hypothetical protein